MSNDSFFSGLKFSLPISLIMWALFVWLVLSVAGCGGASVGTAPTAAAPLPPLAQAEPTTVPALPYEIVKQGGPVVVLLGLDAHNMLYSGISSGYESTYLLQAGYTLMSMDLPCHGENQNPYTFNNEAWTELDCWALRLGVAHEDALFTTFCAQLSHALDEVGAQEAAIVGVSRGGYVAMTCASYDPRLSVVVLIEPATDLNYKGLAEFANYPVNETLFGTSQFIPYLRRVPVLVRVGSDDTRVGTSLVEAFAAKVGATLQVVPEPAGAPADGHEALEDGSTIEWLRQVGYAP